MAGDWIKWTKGLTRKREVIAIAAELGVSRREAAAMCMEVWDWADENTADGNVNCVTKALLDEVVGVTGIAQAMINSGWLTENQDGISFPNFERHNGKSAKKRAETGKRVAKHRAADCNAIVTQKALPEKRREEKSIKGGLPPLDPPAEQRFLSLWNSAAGVTKIHTLTDSRRDKLRTRIAGKVPLADGKLVPWLDALAAAIEIKFPLQCARGDPHGWKPDFDFISRPDTVTKILEGKYDWTKHKPNEEIIPI